LLSAKVLNERLRKMIRFGIVQRPVFGEKPPVEVEYRLTPFGLRFMRILDEVRGLQEALDQGCCRKRTKPKQRKRNTAVVQQLDEGAGLLRRRPQLNR
jgi:DNA-binding HxlR family transcriptional regulator